MSKKKCYNCGITENPSANIKTDNSKQLVWEMGMKDLNGLIMHLIYCRSCGTVNIYKPGWFGNIKFDQFLKYEILLDKIKRGEAEADLFRVVTPRIQIAMKKDGVLPSNWKVSDLASQTKEKPITKTKVRNFSPDLSVSKLFGATNKVPMTKDELLDELILMRQKIDPRLQGSPKPGHWRMFKNWQQPEALILIISYQIFWLKNGGLSSVEALQRIDKDFISFRKTEAVQANSLNDYVTKKILQADKSYPIQIVEKQVDAAIHNVEAEAKELFAKPISSSISEYVEEASIDRVRDEFEKHDVGLQTSTLWDLRFILLFNLTGDQIDYFENGGGVGYRLKRDGHIIARARTVIF